MLGLAPVSGGGDAFWSAPVSGSSSQHLHHEMISPGGINLPTPEVASNDPASEAAARRLQQRINRLSAELCCQVLEFNDVCGISDEATPGPAPEAAVTSFKRWSDPKELVTRRVRARIAAAQPQQPRTGFELLIAEASPATCRNGTLQPSSPRYTLTPLGRLNTPGCRSEIADFEAAPRYRDEGQARACA